MRVLARDNAERRRRLAVRQGPLRLPGDPRRRAHHRSRWCATAASCARSRGSARSRRPRALWRAAGRVGALVGGRPTNEEGFLLAAPDARGARLRRHRLARRRHAAARPRRARSRAPALQATVPDLEFAHTVLRARLRAARRRADPRPADPQGRAPPRRQAGGRHAPARARSTRTPRPSCASPRAPARRSCARSTPRCAGERPRRLAGAAGADADAVRRSPTLLRDGGEDIVILWGERLLGAGAPAAARC